jgi:TPR repeat protein
MSFRYFSPRCWLPVLTVVFCVGGFTANAQDEPSADKVAEYRKAAEQGDASAQYKLGVCYDSGEGVAKDEMEAVKWWRKAAEQGDAMAQFDLGVCYDSGEGVAKDKIEAVKWWRKAAEQGYAPAQFNLGNSYAQGEGVVKDTVEAYKWFNLASVSRNKAYPIKVIKIR